MLTKIKSINMMLCLFVFLFAASALHAEDSTEHLDICISGNYWMPGSINIEGYDFDKSGGLLFRGYVDSIVLDKLCFGAFLNLAPSVEVESESGSMYEFGASFKYRALPGGMPLKIGVNVGYRKTDSDSLNDEIEGLGVNLSVELQFKTESSVKPFIEGGFLSQPAGGNGYVEVTWAPIIYFGGGIAF